MGTWSERPPTTLLQVKPFKRIAPRAFDIQGANLGDILNTVVANAPPIGSLHPIIGSVYCIDWTVTPVDQSPNHALLIASYETPAGFSADGDPTRIPTEWDWDLSLSTVKTDRDWLGNPLVMSNGEPWSETQAPLASALFSGTKYIVGSAWSPLKFGAYLGAQNTDTVTVDGDQFPPGTLRINGIHPAKKKINGAFFVQLTIKFEYNLLGFPLSSIDQAFSYYKFLGTSWAQTPAYFYVAQERDSQPHLLNGCGGKVDAPVSNPLWGSAGAGPPGATVQKISDKSGNTIAYRLNYQWGPQLAFATLPVF